MLPSPRICENVLAPISFQRGGAEIPTIRASAIWRKSRRHRAGVVSTRAAWIALVGQCLVVGCSVFASLAPPSLPYILSLPALSEVEGSKGRQKCCELKSPTFVPRSL